MTVEKKAAAPSGWLMLCLLVLASVADVALYLWSAAGLSLGVDDAVYGPMLLGAIVLTVVIAVLCGGFFTIQPGQARVCVLFGNYVGTVRTEGFHWANPFYSRKLGSSDEASVVEDLDDAKAALLSKGLSTKVSVRARTLNGERLKVNDKVGNPIEIADVVVWHVEDTAKALFDVDDYPSYVAMQAETALRHVASIYPYDHTGDSSDSSDVITLRSNVEEVSAALREELSCRLEPAGVVVDDARLTHLAYASEIAQAMLRRQQAEAVIAARRKIVEGAVGMVEMAVNELARGGAVDLDDERRAAMASNLMVVLCGDSEAHPVINTGSLY
ncbi:SPFH domain-containing protein [Caniella muris]|uniref:SPFH domain-containing protein n=1 Tax=Caniella muris TaxID=2941502 RepID=UPI00203ACA67|nr:SPFH domain-containing protein [Caniella muris]